MFMPMREETLSDGSTDEWPSRKDLTLETVRYWEARSVQTAHPVLQARYAALVWEFCPKVGSKRTRATADLAIEAALAVARDNRHSYETCAEGLLVRSVRLAISIKDNALVKTCLNALFEYEQLHGRDEAPGLWGRAFDLVSRSSAIATSVGDDFKRLVLDDLAGRLARIIATSTNPAHAAKHAALRLAQHYRASGNSTAAEDIMRKYGQAVIEWIRNSGASGLMASAFLEELREDYYRFNMSSDVKNLLPLLRFYNKQIPGEMKSFGQEFSVTDEQLEQEVASVLCDTVDETAERIAIRFLPSMLRVRAGARKIAEGSVVFALFGGVRVDHEGRSVGKIAGSEAGDVDGYWRMSLMCSGVFLGAALDRLFQRSDAKSAVVDFLVRSPLIGNERKPLVESAVNQYSIGDWVAFIHVSIPLLETAMRQLVESQGGRVYDYDTGPNGGTRMRTLGALLGDEVVTGFLAPDIVEHFRRLLASDDGLNLRNDVCHGLCSPDTFGKTVGDWVLHALLLVASTVEALDEGAQYDPVSPPISDDSANPAGAENIQPTE